MRPRLALVPVLLAVGCAFATTSDGMAPGPLPGDLPRGPSVNLRAAGGRATSLWGKSQISNAGFDEALARALLQRGLLLPLVDRPADYQLEVDLRELRQPDFSLVTRVELTVDWTLWSTRTGEVLWRDAIHTSHTATPWDALIGTRRCRLATEGAARANIRAAIEQLARLGLAADSGPADPPPDSR
jgi:hypothetical protein